MTHDDQQQGELSSGRDESSQSHVSADESHARGLPAGVGYALRLLTSRRSRVLLTGAAQLVLLLWALTWLSRRLLFPAPLLKADPPDLAAHGGVQIWLPSKTEAWLLRPYTDAGAKSSHGLQPGEPAPLLVFTHGNGEVIDDWVNAFEPARQAGLAVLLVEYPGYGRSAGSPSEASIEKTMSEVAVWISQRPSLDAGRVVAYGRSLGGGAAGLFARHFPVRALVLESTFSSVTDVARDKYIPGWLVRDTFDTAETLRSLAVPVLVLHGKNDTLIAPRHAQDLARAAGEAQLEWLDCGHNDCGRSWPIVLPFLHDAHLFDGPP